MIFLKSIKTMRKIRYLFLFLFLISCAAAEDAKKVFKNEKVKTTDEFLVKKKQPLELPPDYSNIPKPNSPDPIKYEASNPSSLYALFKNTL